MIRRVPVRRLRALAVLALVLTAGILLTACNDEEYQGGDVTIEGVGYSADGSTYTVRITSARVGPGSDAWPIQTVRYLWTYADGRSWSSADFRPVLDGTTVASGATLSISGDRTSVTGTFTAPVGPAGAKLRVEVRSTAVDRSCQPLFGCEHWTYTKWSNDLDVAAAPTARVFAANSPPGEEQTLLDARLSTGTGALTYTWTPACRSEVGAELPAGVTRVPYAFGGTCTVTVTDTSSGRTDTASIEVPAASFAMHNAWLDFDGAGMVTLYAPYSAANPAFACVNLNGGAPLKRTVALDHEDPVTHRKYATIALPTADAGLHRVTASFWPADAAGCSTNSGLSGPGLIQVASALYDGTTRQARASRQRYSARSRLRLASGTILREGRMDRFGTRRGAVARGRFTWRMPARGGGVRRPAALGRLVAGAYVSRVVQMSFGPRSGAKAPLLGRTIVLLRGRSGALACARIDGFPEATTFTLLGGTGALARQAAVLSGGAATFPLPTTAAGWRSASIPPTRIAGTLIARRGGHRLPAACRALRRYLP